MTIDISVVEFRERFPAMNDVIVFPDSLILHQSAMAQCFITGYQFVKRSAGRYWLTAGGLFSRQWPARNLGERQLKNGVRRG